MTLISIRCPLTESVWGRSTWKHFSFFLVPSLTSFFTFSHFSSLFINVFLVSTTHPGTTYYSWHTHTLAPFVWMFILLSHLSCIHNISIVFSVCHQAIINQHSYLAGGKRCEAEIWWEWHSETRLLIKSLALAKKQCTHAYLQTRR